MDAPQRIARPVLADPEQLVARARAWRGHARLELTNLDPPAKRGESRKDQRDLRVDCPRLPSEESERVARLQLPRVRSHRSPPQRAEHPGPRPPGSRHDPGAGPYLLVTDPADRPDRSACAPGGAKRHFELKAVAL